MKCAFYVESKYGFRHDTTLRINVKEKLNF